MKAIIKSTGEKISAEKAKRLYLNKNSYDENMYMCSDDDCHCDLILAAKENNAMVETYFRAKNHHAPECEFYSELDTKLNNPKSGMTITYGTAKKSDNVKKKKQLTSDRDTKPHKATSASIKRLLKKYDQEYFSVTKFLNSENNFRFKDNTTNEGPISINKYFVQIKTHKSILSCLDKYRVFYGIVKFWYNESGDNRKSYVKMSFADPFYNSQHIDIYINEYNFENEFLYLKNLYNKQTMHNSESVPSIGLFIRALVKEPPKQEGKLIINEITDIWLASLRKVK